MNVVDYFNLQTYHNTCTLKYGKHHVGSLGWKTKEGQIKRFETLTEIADLSNCSVLDIGCGHGDLCSFITNNFVNVRYFGIDIQTSFLDIAIEKNKAIDNTAFFAGDFTITDLPVVDYVLASGILNYRNIDANYVYKAISKLYNTCRLGFAFNMLSKIENENTILYAYDKQHIFDYCTTLSKNVVLIEGYYEDDFTLVVYR
jgi:SAM-dependent methyltransferase